MMMETAAEKIDRMRNLLAFMLIGAFVTVLPVLIWKVIPKDNEQIITYMLGQLSGMATLALGYYFVNKAGQDAADAKKSENTGKLADAIRATAEAATVSEDKPKGTAGDPVHTTTEGQSDAGVPSPAGR